MKRLVLLVLIVSLCLALIACDGASFRGQSEKLKVVASIFPLYDFARNLCGDDAETQLLLKTGADAHSYEPTPQDLVRISECDLFLYVGGESDEYLETMLASLPQVVSLRLIDAVVPIAEADEPGQADEHIWTSPKCAAAITRAICEKLCALSPEHAQSFHARESGYLHSLDALDQAFSEFAALRRTLVFADRFPFAYLARDYDIPYLAALEGCGEESEPSAANLAKIIETVRSQKLPCVFYTESSDRRIAENVASETGCEIALFHSCHNVSAPEMAQGLDYLTLMQNNLSTLRAVFGIGKT